MYPMYELSTIRSITENESKSVVDIEPSKFASNYGVVLKVVCTLLRCNESLAIKWMKKLCSLEELQIDWNRLPISINLNVESDATVISTGQTFKGLESERKQLENMNLEYKLLGARNVYELLLDIHSKKRFVTQHVDKLTYYPKGTVLEFKSNYDYGLLTDSHIPFHLKHVIVQHNESRENFSTRQFINASGSYDGKIPVTFEYYDMLSLAKCLNAREEFI